MLSLPVALTALMPLGTGMLSLPVVLTALMPLRSCYTVLVWTNWKVDKAVGRDGLWGMLSTGGLSSSVTTLLKAVATSSTPHVGSMRWRVRDITMLMICHRLRGLRLFYLGFTSAYLARSCTDKDFMPKTACCQQHWVLRSSAFVLLSSLGRLLYCCCITHCPLLFVFEHLGARATSYINVCGASFAPWLVAQPIKPYLARSCTDEVFMVETACCLQYWVPYFLD